MEFCPKCGTRLQPVREKKRNSISVLSCSKCGFEKKNKNDVNTSAKLVQHPQEESIVVIGKEAQKLRTLPTVKIECPKCENTLAYVWQVQTRGSDESSTQFFRCTKCKFTFREYS